MNTRAEINLHWAVQLNDLCLSLGVKPRLVPMALFLKLKEAPDRDAYQKAVADICIAIHDAINN